MHFEVDVEQHRVVAEGHVDALERHDPLAAARPAAQGEAHPAALEHRPIDLVHAVDLHLLDAGLFAARAFTVMCAQCLKRRTASSSRAISFCYVT